MPSIRNIVIRLLEKHNPNFEASLHTDQKLFVDMGNSVGRSIWLHKRYEPDIEKVMGEILSEEDTFLDIGSNVGYFAIIAAHHYVPKGAVLALEPNLALSSLLQRSVRRNGVNNLWVFPLAAGGAPAIEMLQIQRSSGVSFVGTSTHSRSDDNIVSTQTVLVETIDNLLQRLPQIAMPRLAKIDVEGREIDVLRGMRRLLERRQTHLIIEHSEINQSRFGVGVHDIARYLSSFDYRSKDIKGNGPINWSRADVLWSPC